MRPQTKKRTLKRQLMVYFVLVAVISSLLLGVYYFTSQKSLIERNTIRSREQSISHAIEMVEGQARQVQQFANQLCRNETVRALMQSAPEEAQRFSPEKRAVIEELNTQFRYVPVTESVLSLFLIGENGLDIRVGVEASLVDYSALCRAFCTGASAERARWEEIRENFTSLSRNKAVLPYCQRIQDERMDSTLGYLVILFRDDLFVRECLSAMELENDAICLMSAEGKVFASNARWAESSGAMESDLFARLRENQTDFSFSERLGGENHVFFRGWSTAPSWILVDAVPAAQMDEQIIVLGRAAVLTLLLAVLAAVVLSGYLSGRFTRPISRMVEAVDDIAQGDFSRKLACGSEYELVCLEEGIGKMQHDLERLIDERMQQEEDKRKAEIRMLKAQINPHFLYNTLNSIKMMASMQGARGIQNMTEALGNILRSSLGSADETVTLTEELALLEQYVYIQNIRYRGNIEYEVTLESPALGDCMLPRFILQPLVENAIQHGIEVAGRGGRIAVRAAAREDKLEVSVWDDGAGIASHQLQSLTASSEENGRHIGVSNVHRRLQMLYGADCGLRFESEVGQYTRVTAVLRMKNGKEG